jgi:hypothetical protein
MRTKIAIAEISLKTEIYLSHGCLLNVWRTLTDISGNVNTTICRNNIQRYIHLTGKLFYKLIVTVYIVVCRHVARQRPRNMQLYNTTAFTRQRPVKSNRVKAFSVRSVRRRYKLDKWGQGRSWLVFHKDKRALPGNLQNRGYSFYPPPHVVSLTATPLSFSLSLSLSLSLSPVG